MAKSKDPKSKTIEAQPEQKPQKQFRKGPIPFWIPALCIALGAFLSIFTSASLVFVNIVQTIAPMTSILNPVRGLIRSAITGTSFGTFLDSFQIHNFSASSAFPLLNAEDMILACLFYAIMVPSLKWVSINLLPEKIPGIKMISTFHNLFLITLSAFMSTDALYQALVISGYKFVGNTCPTTPIELGLSRIVWIFFFSKVIEWMDTVLIILARDWRRLSWLHLYHHLSIFSIWWAIAKSCPGADAYYCVFLNSLVHVIMYSYYLLSSFGYKIWFKKYITWFQMFQFVTMMMHSGFDVFNNVHPVRLHKLNMVYMVSLLVLFQNFSKKTYPEKGKGETKPKTE